MHKIYSDKKFLFAFCGILTFSALLWGANLFKQNLYFKNYFGKNQMDADLQEVGKYLLANQMINIKMLNPTGDAFKMFCDSIGIKILNPAEYKNYIGLINESPVCVQLKSRKGQTGFLKLSNLKIGSYLEFMKNLETITNNVSLDTLVLDIRDVKGGQYTEAIKIANQLETDEKVPMAYTTFFEDDSKPINSTGNNFFPQKLIMVLVEEEMDDVGKYFALLLQNNRSTQYVGQGFKVPVTIYNWYPLSSGNFATVPTGFLSNKDKKVSNQYTTLPVHFTLSQNQTTEWLDNLLK